MSIAGARFTALVMAGSRPTGDRLATATGVRHKALAPIAGEPLLKHVLRTLQAANAVKRIAICGLDRADAIEIGLGAEIDSNRFDLVAGAETPGASAASAIEQLGLESPMLITTADHPLLTPETVDDFCGRAAALDADVAFGLVPAPLVSAAFPAIRRTNYLLREGAFCGCNLYALLTPAARAAPTMWMRVERYRKRPWRMFLMLGPSILLRFLTGRLALANIGELGRKVSGLSFQAVQLTDPAAGFDVDNLEQLAAAESYLRARR